MKKFLFWFLAFIITLGAAYYQRTTGPTYPKRVDVSINGQKYELKLVRSLGLDEPSEIKLTITDTTVKAKLYFRRYPSGDEYQVTDFQLRENSGKKGFYANVTRQPAAGKIQYYIEITDSKETRTYLREKPVELRFKGSVPLYILLPHVLLMFMAMLFSTLAGLMSIGRHPLYRKYTVWTLILLFGGGFILGPLVQYYAFGEFWTGVPFGWDLTDNKTLIALFFWVLAVIMNRKKERPLYTALAAIVLLLVFSIPHSMFGSELNYNSGSVTQGIIMNFFMK